ncbi:MAG: hypothetical protein HY788_06555 [Deltaproteobacteria bacterium]|nr:hypothetical protein [Deltaproteobacteria bacterium]
MRMMHGCANIGEKHIEPLKTYDMRRMLGACAFARVFALVVLAATPFSSSCGFLQQAVSEEWKWTRPSPYLQAYDKWTREGRVYAGLSTEMAVQATLMSPDFRKALIAKRSRDFLYPPAEEKRLLETERIESQRVLDFTVFVFTPETKFSELRPGKSIWRIHLENRAGQRLKPARIEKLPCEYDVLMRDYPRINRWAFPYRVRFEAPDTGGLAFISTPGESLTLWVTGCLGTARMSWDCDWVWPPG